MLIMPVGKQSHICNSIEYFKTKIYLCDCRINSTEQKKTEELSLCLVLRRSIHWLKSANPMKWFSSTCANKSGKWSKSLTKIWLNQQNSIITKVGEHRWYHSARLGRVNAHRHHWKELGNPTPGERSTTKPREPWAAPSKQTTPFTLIPSIKILLRKMLI